MLQAYPVFRLTTYLDSLPVGFQLFCLREGASAMPVKNMHRSVSCQLGSDAQALCSLGLRS